MVKVTTLYLLQLCLFFGTKHEQARVPQWVFKVDSCPSPNNISKWQDASKRLHCLHDLNASDMGNTYHCLPSSYLNETVEFCGKGIPIPPGHCPIYDYKVNADDKPDLYNCSTFSSGCPTKTFSSKDVRKFLSCLNINRKYRCYEEESNCPNTSVLSTIPTDSSPDNTKLDDKITYVVIIICVVILTGLILLYKRTQKESEAECKPLLSETPTDVLEPVDKLTAEAKPCGQVPQPPLKSCKTKMKTESLEDSDRTIVECDENSEMSIKERDINKDTVMMEKREEEKQKLKDFRESTGCCITVIKNDKALSESNFVYFRLRFRRNPYERLFKTVRNVLLTIPRHRGQSLEGREILIRTIPSKRKGHDDQSDPNSETVLQMNQYYLLENLELIVILEKSEIASLLSTEEIIRMKKIESRKERAKFFLEDQSDPNSETVLQMNQYSLLENLEHIVHLQKSEIASLLSTEEIIRMKKIESRKERAKFFDSLKCWIQDNRETLLDEIDSDLIETTTSHMEDVPCEVYTLCRDPSKGRKKKPTYF